ncbi:hypothetical protein ACHAP5_003510 [Fusarium lateritium]
MELDSQNHVPKHRTLSPKRSCLKPSTSKTGVTTGSGDDLRTNTRPREFKWLRVSNAVKVNNVDWSDDSIPDQDEELGGPATESDESSSEFTAHDEEIERLLNRATDICDANERAAIIRGSLDFLMTVCNRIYGGGPVVILSILERLGPRSIGSYVGDEREFANGYKFIFEVPDSLYRNKETSMSWGRHESSMSWQGPETGMSWNRQEI